MWRMIKRRERGPQSIASIYCKLQEIGYEVQIVQTRKPYPDLPGFNVLVKLDNDRQEMMFNLAFSDSAELTNVDFDKMRSLTEHETSVWEAAIFESNHGYLPSEIITASQNRTRNG